MRYTNEFLMSDASFDRLRDNNVRLTGKPYTNPNPTYLGRPIRVVSSDIIHTCNDSRLLTGVCAVCGKVEL